ncbi:hypothetical protein H0A36_00020 [Endozoicomonas sp. SM1973]|uniref:Haemolysin-type calcium binding-related domain-containing protein n=1 Tax=Spartinivicinus marinus TaxID=2994442 RepID=A0A853HRD8_9GAMM|nr:calcium-binding protein [Spartinivicinus marinus]NYZ64370.1 hypothetical protein [Spartinivicinus marinus]
MDSFNEFDSTLEFNRGSGEVVFQGQEEIVFAEDISESDLKLERKGDTLFIKLKGTQDSLAIHGFEGLMPETLFVFANGNEMEFEEFLTGYEIKYRGTRDNDILVGTVASDKLYGSRGNDTLQGGEGADKLYGGSGDDELRGEQGNDLLSGGSGNDRLDGGEGSDTYIFRKGNGHDTIVDHTPSSSSMSSENQDTNTLVIDKRLLAEDIWLEQNQGGPELTIHFGNTGDAITLDRDSIQVFQIGEEQLSYEDMRQRYETRSHGSGTPYRDVLTGHEGDDTLNGHEGDDKLYGMAGNDFLEGGQGNDVLVGGAGNDHLNGGDGSDTYYFSEGDGHDRIDDSSSLASAPYPGEEANINTLVLDPKLIAKGAWFDEQDTLHFGNSSDSISFNHDAIQVFQIGDEQLSYEDMRQRYETRSHGSGTPYRDVLTGHEGDDTLNGHEGDDKLYGMAGNDFLEGGQGNDVLVGGAGNDHLNGGDGSDTYYFSEGDGKDTIVNNQYNPEEFDQLVLSNIAKDELSFSRKDNTLVINVKDGSDQVSVENWFGGESNQLDQIKTSDGVVSASQVDELIHAMAGFAGSNDGSLEVTLENRPSVITMVAPSLNS